MRAGAWLGPYDDLTLLRGMFYPLFIAAAALLAVPLNIAEQLAWLAAAALAARFLWRATGSGLLCLATFAALAFNPVLLTPEMARAIRDALYPSLALGVVALGAAAAFPPTSARGWSTGVGLGLALAAFWLTREEAVWLLPALAALVAPAALALARYPTRARGAGPARSFAVAGLVFAAALACVASLNWRAYGVFALTEVTSGAFPRAYGAIARIAHDEWRPRVVFPKDARARAYAVSPAARELAPVLDGVVGEAWHRSSCTLSATEDCPEILSGWFWLALRDAASGAGHYRSAPEAAAFYDRLAREIDDACAAGRIQCGPARATLRPAFRWADVPEAGRHALILLRLLLHLGDGRTGPAPSTGPRAGLAPFIAMAGDVAPFAASGQRVLGWAAAHAGRPSLSLRLDGAGRADVTLTQTIGADVEANLPGWRAARFTVDGVCVEQPCVLQLVVTAPGTAPATVLPLDKLSAGMAADSPTLRVMIDGVVPLGNDAGTAARYTAQYWTARGIARVYGTAIPALTVAALLGLVIGVARRRRARLPTAVLALAVASLLAFAARVALLGYVDVTAIPVILPHPGFIYAAVATPFLILFAVSGTWCLWRQLRAAVAERWGDGAG